ncbi:hypothetical protein HDE_07144 [Halotydeus destructor]|nr:hypothetical protein HDE_07144 [Halotydeus destructor]
MATWPLSDVQLVGRELCSQESAGDDGHKEEKASHEQSQNKNKECLFEKYAEKVGLLSMCTYALGYNLAWNLRCGKERQSPKPEYRSIRDKIWFSIFAKNILSSNSACGVLPISAKPISLQSHTENVQADQSEILTNNTAFFASPYVSKPSGLAEHHGLRPNYKDVAKEEKLFEKHSNSTDFSDKALEWKNNVADTLAYEIGMAYVRGKDYASAAEILSQLEGNKTAQFNAGVLYHQGKHDHNHKPDFKLASVCYKKASKLGHVDAKNNLDYLRQAGLLNPVGVSAYPLNILVKQDQEQPRRKLDFIRSDLTCNMLSDNLIFQKTGQLTSQACLAT